MDAYGVCTMVCTWCDIGPNNHAPFVQAFFQPLDAGWWEWAGDARGSWESYPASVQAILEAAWVARPEPDGQEDGSDHMGAGVRGRDAASSMVRISDTWVVDLPSMKQRRINDFGRWRAVRRT